MHTTVSLLLVALALTTSAVYSQPPDCGVTGACGAGALQSVSSGFGSMFTTFVPLCSSYPHSKQISDFFVQFSGDNGNNIMSVVLRGDADGWQYTLITGVGDNQQSTSGNFASANCGTGCFFPCTLGFQITSQSGGSQTWNVSMSCPAPCSVWSFTDWVTALVSDPPKKPFDTAIHSLIMDGISQCHDLRDPPLIFYDIQLRTLQGGPMSFDFAPVLPTDPVCGETATVDPQNTTISLNWNQFMSY